MKELFIETINIHSKFMNIQDKKIKIILDKIFENPEVCKYLKTIKSYDESLYNHSLRVAMFSLNIGVELNLDNKSLCHLGTGALLHDIGKIFIPSKILRKPGKLTFDEFEVMKSHTKLGYDLLKNAPLSKEVKNIVLNHHERPNGKGYPNEIKDVDKLSQIVAIGDTYDAITSQRVYQKAQSPEIAIKVIFENEGNQFNQTLANFFYDKICY